MESGGHEQAPLQLSVVDLGWDRPRDADYLRARDILVDGGTPPAPVQQSWSKVTRARLVGAFINPERPSARGYVRSYARNYTYKHVYAWISLSRRTLFTTLLGRLSADYWLRA